VPYNHEFIVKYMLYYYNIATYL